MSGTVVHTVPAVFQFTSPINNQIFVSNTLQEDNVGLEEVDDGVYDLYFCFYQIGGYELRSNKIHDIVSKVGLSVKRVDHASKV